MTLKKRLRVGVFSLVAAASLASVLAPGSALAGAPGLPEKVLSETDARAYAQAFDAIDQGDFLGAELQAAEIQDKALSGYLSFRALMHPTAHKASFDELSAWLGKFRDLPLADKIFSLAAKRKPVADAVLPVPEVVTADAARSEITKPAREAFYSGDARTAFTLAVGVGERWIAGLSAWRLGDYGQAHDYFAQLAHDSEEDPWLRAAGAYWAARAAVATGDQGAARAFLNLAAQAPHTFYGMIAERQIRLVGAQAETGQIVLAAFRTPEPSPQEQRGQLVRNDPRAHRAAALVQLGRMEDARQELRAGLALARTARDRVSWRDLLVALTPPGAGPQRAASFTEYQTPPLEPKAGFTVDKALVYAIVRQESAFNPRAVSHAGALGLMQIIPASATLATGDPVYRRKPKVLFDPSVNLSAGQAYLTWLMDRGVGGDILRTVAAYNAGPGAVLKTTAMVGEDDPLLLIECLPALETRNYVEKVMTAYWTYKRMFGEETHTLDALAGGARRIDARLDLPRPAPAQPQVAAEPFEIGRADIQQAISFD